MLPAIYCVVSVDECYTMLSLIYSVSSDKISCWYSTMLLIKRIVSGIMSLFFIHNIAFTTNISFATNIAFDL
jgi:hypothetical protein